MAYDDITDPASIQAALHEFDALGRDAFLAKYGFGRARRYFLIADGKRYDSKAILGAAHAYEFPAEGPLGHTDFNGGDATVRPKLESLGFTVDTEDASAMNLWAPVIAEMAELRAAPNFDAEERDYKLIVAEKLRGAATQEITDLAAWADGLKQALGAPNNLTFWMNNSALISNVSAPENAALRDAIRGCYDTSRTTSDRFASFASASGLQPGAALELGALLLFSAQPETLPPIRQSVLERVAKRVGEPGGATLPVVERYGHYLQFAEECRDRLIDANVPVRDMLDVQSLIWMLHDPAEVSAAPKIWVEKTHVKGRPDRIEGEIALGRALWSPAKSTNGRDVYRFMREVSAGDVILHLTDSEGFTGRSRVAAAYADYDGAPNTEWGTQPSYLVQLEDFEQLAPPLLRETFLNDEFGPRLVAQLDHHRNLFYNREPSLNQGAYLTPLPATVLAVLNDAYRSIAGKALVEMQDVSEPEEGGAPAPPSAVVVPTAAAISAWLSSPPRSLTYSPRSVAIFLTALQTKGFVILSGVSGTGKTKLAQSIGQLIADDHEDQHVFVSVRPDWRDSRGLIGYFNPLSGHYESTPLLRLLSRSRGVDGQRVTEQLRTALAAQSQWLVDLQAVVDRLGQQTEFDDDDLKRIWQSRDNGVANAGPAPSANLPLEQLREVTKDLSEHGRSVPERLLNARAQFEEAGLKRLPILRILRALAIFEPTRVSTAVDATSLTTTARRHFGYQGANLHELIRNEDAEGLDVLFRTVETGVLNLLGPDASVAERTAAPYLLSQILDEPGYGPAIPTAPYFVTLDEMNLARVEYYFAEFLSVLESGRDPRTGRTREAIALHDRAQPAVHDEGGATIPAQLHLAPNLYFVGTINVDETTHNLSPKVLDRAFTIEIDDINFGASTASTAPQPDSTQLREAFSRHGEFALVDHDIQQTFAKQHPDWTTWLQSLSDALRPHDLHFAYRTFDEIAMFTTNAVNAPWFDGFSSSEIAAFDVACLTKILPKFSGVRARLREPLLLTLAWAINPDAPDVATVAQLMESPDGKLPDAVLPSVAAKAERMLRRLVTTGFASYA